MSALTAPHEHADIGTLTIASAAGLVCALDNVSWQSQNTNVDVRGACRPGQLNQRVKRQGTLQAKFFGGSSGGFVSTDMDLTSLTVGGVNVVPQLYQITINGSFDKQRLPAIGVSGLAEGVVGQNYAGNLELQIDDTDVVQTLVIAAEGADETGAQAALSLVIGGKTIAFPIQIDGVTHASSQGQYQRVTLPYVSQAPARGTAFPTSPTALPGSPGLIDYALVTPRSNLAFTYASKLTHGLVRTGYLTWDQFAMTIADGAVTDFNYTWKTFGDWSTTNNGTES